MLRTECWRPRLMGLHSPSGSEVVFKRCLVSPPPTRLQWAGFFSNTLATRTGPGVRQSVEHEGACKQDTSSHSDYTCHVHNRGDGSVCVLIGDRDYPTRVAYALMAKYGDQFSERYRSRWDSSASLPYPELEGLLRQYQDPAEADKLTRIQKDLEDTKIILHRTIDDLLERGERLESLVEKSDRLSASSKQFYKSARATNSCCVIQ